MDSEEEDLAQAIALSKGESAEARDQSDVKGQFGGFRYGVDYPKPIIQPVSLTNTEEQEQDSRREQAKRDHQIASSKRRRETRGSSFNRPQWEQSRRQWPAETPTGARQSSKLSPKDASSESGGVWRGRSCREEVHACSEDTYGDRTIRTERGHRDSKGVGKGRRWGNRQAVN